MSTISFTKPAAGPTGVVAPPTPAAAPERTLQLAQPSPEALAVSHGAASAQFSGAWSHDDERLPRINLVHKTSKAELIEKFGIGSFCLSQEVKLSDGKTPLIVTAVHIYKDYVQKLPEGSKDSPKSFKTPQDVIDNGGSLQYKDAPSGNYFGPRGTIQLVAEAPADVSEDDASHFPFEFDGKIYTMAMLTVSSSAYTSAAKEIRTLAGHNKAMIKGLQYGSLSLVSKLITTPRFSWLIPVIKFDHENSPELAAFFASMSPTAALAAAA